MKRSEMLQIMNDAYIKFGTHSSTTRDRMHHVLTEMEKAGMQPPVIRILQTSYNRAEGQMGFDVNEWDEENGSDSKVQPT